MVSKYAVEFFEICYEAIVRLEVERPRGCALCISVRFCFERSFLAT